MPMSSFAPARKLESSSQISASSGSRRRSASFGSSLPPSNQAATKRFHRRSMVVRSSSRVKSPCSGEEVVPLGGEGGEGAGARAERLHDGRVARGEEPGRAVVALHLRRHRPRVAAVDAADARLRSPRPVARDAVRRGAPRLRTMTSDAAARRRGAGSRSRYSGRSCASGVSRGDICPAALKRRGACRSIALPRTSTPRRNCCEAPIGRARSSCCLRLHGTRWRDCWECSRRLSGTGRC